MITDITHFGIVTSIGSITATWWLSMLLITIKSKLFFYRVSYNDKQVAPPSTQVQDPWIWSPMRLKCLTVPLDAAGRLCRSHWEGGVLKCGVSMHSLPTPQNTSVHDGKVLLVGSRGSIMATNHGFTYLQVLTSTRGLEWIPHGFWGPAVIPLF